MSRRHFLATAAAVALGLTFAGNSVAADFPARPITLIVPWSAGGGTDAVARIVAGGLEKQLGQPVNVVNRTGGSGVVGHQAIASARADGYTIGLITAEINMMHHQGLTELTYEAYRPLALVNTDPAGVQVSASSPYKSVKELLDAMKGGTTVKFSGSGQGSIWHLAMAGLLLRADIPATSGVWVPSQGAAPAMQELASGGVDVVLSSVPEGRAMVEAGRAKSIAIMSDIRDTAYPDIPTLKEETGVNWIVASSWRGFVAPKGTPDDVAAKLEAALKVVYDSAEYQDFMKQRGFGVVWADSAGLGHLLAEKETELGEVMKAAGLAK